MEYVYLTKEDILEYHNDIINEIGGSHGVREEGGIERIVDFIQNDLYYPTLVDKLTYLVFGLCSGHYFMDGNKRISIVAAAHFLIKNKKLWAGARFFEYFHSYAWHIAAGNIDKDLFARIVDCYINNREMDESLQLGILHAISKGQICNEKETQVVFQVTTQVERTDIKELNANLSQVVSQVKGADLEQVVKVFISLQKAMSMAELMEMFSQVNRTRFKRTCLDILIQTGLATPTVPDKPNSRFQKYVLTEKGKSLIESVNKQKEP